MLYMICMIWCKRMVLVAQMRSWNWNIQLYHVCNVSWKWSGCYCQGWWAGFWVIAWWFVEAVTGQEYFSESCVATSEKMVQPSPRISSYLELFWAQNLEWGKTTYQVLYANEMAEIRTCLLIVSHPHVRVLTYKCIVTLFLVWSEMHFCRPTDNSRYCIYNFCIAN